MVFFPNAKINIGLNIVARREDGFHNIESVFYPVSHLYDVLEIVENKEGGLIFDSSGINIPGNTSTNLCVRAFDVIKKDFSIPDIKVHLHKAIPIGAGLGGGSSDGTFMLKALDTCFNLNLSKEQLESYANSLGSDCAFFVNNTCAYVTEKGDHMEPFDLNLSGYSIKIDFPGIHIDSSIAYSQVIPKKSETSLKELLSSPVKTWKDKIKNDFERSIFPQYPEVEKLKESMYDQGAIYASMSGSGSAVYGIFPK